MGHQPCTPWCREHAGTNVCCVAPTCWLWGLPYPGDSSWDLTRTQVLEGFSPRDKWQSRRKCLIPSPRQQGAGMRQLWKLRGQWQGKARRKPQQLQRDQGAQPCRHRQAQGSAHAGAPWALPSCQQINGSKQTPFSADRVPL